MSCEERVRAIKTFFYRREIFFVLDDTRGWKVEANRRAQRNRVVSTASAKGEQDDRPANVQPGE
jgi:hypothetical protein